MSGGECGGAVVEQLRPGRPDGHHVVEDVAEMKPRYPLMTHSYGIDDAETALQVAADPGSGSSKVMLRLDSATPHERMDR